MAVNMLGLVGAAFVVLVIGAIVIVALLASGTRSPSPTAHPAFGETPLQILDRRFAAGEITAEDYRKARDLLREAAKT